MPRFSVLLGRPKDAVPTLATSTNREVPTTALQLILSLPTALLATALIQDFFAGLADDRIWSEPASDDSVAPYFTAPSRPFTATRPRWRRQRMVRHRGGRLAT